MLVFSFQFEKEWVNATPKYLAGAIIMKGESRFSFHVFRDRELPSSCPPFRWPRGTSRCFNLAFRPSASPSFNLVKKIVAGLAICASYLPCFSLLTFPSLFLRPHRRRPVVTPYRFSPFVAMCFTVNYIMGTGFLTLPWAFNSAGIGLSLVVLGGVCLISDISKGKGDYFCFVLCYMLTPPSPSNPNPNDRLCS